MRRAARWRCAEAVGLRMSRARSSGRSTIYRLTHLNAARPREKVEECPALQESKSLSYLVLTTHVQHVLSAKARSR